VTKNERSKNVDEIKTGVFEISTTWNDFWKDWQLELAKEDLRRRARTAMDKIMRDGVPYVTCLYPVKEGGGKLVLTAFCVLAQYEDCEIGDAAVCDWMTGRDRIKDYDGRAFELEAHTDRHNDPIYIYRRVL
jgi:hypothetical protein